MAQDLPVPAELPAPGTMTAQVWHAWCPVFAQAAQIRPLSPAAVAGEVSRRTLRSAGMAYMRARASGANAAHAAIYATLCFLLALGPTLFVATGAWWNALQFRLAWELAVVHGRGRFWIERSHTNAEVRVLVMQARSRPQE